MNDETVHVRIDERRRRAVEVGTAGTSLREPPCFAAVVGTQDPAHFYRRISTLATEGESPHASRFRRIGQGPAVSISQLCYFGASPPVFTAIVRKKNACRFCSGKFEVRNIGMIGHPASMPD